MSGSNEFLLYVTVYRLSVLAIGALSIYLGFRMFIHPPGRTNSTEEASSAAVQAGGFRLRLTNFLPGTYFALFGTVLIGIMLWRGEPQMLRKEVVETRAQNGSESTYEVVETRAQNGSESTYRNEELYRTPEVDLNAVPVSDLDQEWETLDTSGMIQAEAAVPLANIAEVWKKEGRIGEALAMARLAYLYGPEIDKAARLSLLADLLEANGRTQDAADARVALEKLRQKAGGEGE